MPPQESDFRRFENPLSYQLLQFTRPVLQDRLSKPPTAALNSPDWVLDVVFHEDLSRLRSGTGPQNMATVRHMAMNLLQGPKDKHSLKVRRKSAAWDTAYLEALLRQSA